MSGHSKWSQIKHKKAKMDAQKGRLFTKLIREIMVAARQGGGNPDANPRLRSAIQAAKEANMPWDNIERAIKKGTGELPGTHYEEATFEGYGPGGVAIMVRVLTDNKNRTSGEIRHIFTKYGGHLGGSGCVAWQFHQKGVIQVEKNRVDGEVLFELALELGAEDMKEEEDIYTIITSPEDFLRIKEALTEKGVPISYSALTMIPDTLVKLEGKKAEQILELVNTLDEHPDVQDVYANFDIPEEIMTKVS
ncbi:YebC/PmpR family DNA-binding transcriptional regulator [Candidatus Calescamantes bacterium]|nr:YebC/PmpR family DNA-binding transcriptional regulator [Candidatus Calescamantes bacterium]